MVTVTGPFSVKAPGADVPAGTGEDHSKCIWLPLAVLVVYLLFMVFVHREGDFDLLTWVATAVALIIDVVVTVLDPCMWHLVMLVVTAAVVALCWMHYTTRDEPEEEP